MHDRSFTIRLPTEILHRLEVRLERAKASNTRQPGTPVNISEAVRHVLKVGLDVLDGGDEAEEWMMDLFGPKLANMVALAATDKDAARLLEKIATRPVEVEPDFG
jgi:hypothetical protein